jgi:hypothetical protein
MGPALWRLERKVTVDRRPETHGGITIHFLPDGIRLEPMPDGILDARAYLNDGDQSDAALWDMLEGFIGNGWANIPPEAIGAMTDAPILSEDFTMSDDGDWIPAVENPVVYWHAAYAVESCIAKWAAGESVFWRKG